MVEQQFRVVLKDSATFEAMWNEACRQGYQREEPRKPWRYQEKRHAVKWLLQRHVDEVVAKVLAR